MSEEQTPCKKCGQVDHGQHGEYPCEECGLPKEHGNLDPPVVAVTKGPSFSEELEHLINSHCMENTSDTPDFILAKFMRSCLSAFDRATKERTNWYKK